MPVPYPSQLIPQVLTSTNSVDTLPNYYIWATISNDGLGNATITWGGGNTLTLLPGKSITLPYTSSVYGSTTIDSTSPTTVRVVYLL